MQVEDAVEQCAIESAVGLFHAYQVILEYADTTERAVMPEAALCGVIGLVGPQMSGALLLAATPEPLASSNPTTASSRDWIAELANQMFGRLRNRLLRRGIELVGTPPTVIRGEGIEALTARKDCRPIVLRGPAGGKVCIWIDCLPRDGLPVRVEDVSAEIEIAIEGTVMLF